MRYHDWTAQDVETFTDLVYGFLPMDQHYQNPNRWHADVTVQETATYRLARWVQRGDRTCHRTRSQVRAHPGDEHYWVVVPRAGGYATRHGDEVVHAVPGYASAMVMDQPCRLLIPRSDSYALQVPRAEIDQHVRSDQPLRAVLDLRSGLGRIVDTMLRELHAERDRLTERDFHAVCDRVTELLCMLLVGDVRPSLHHLDEVAATVRRYVRQHVGSDQLGLADAARALGWSPRQVRLALQRAGTTYRDLRRDETLRRARDLLVDPAYAELTVTEVAHRAGLAPAWFSAAFKDRYGEPPREFRRRRLAERATTAR
ncbi:MAG TPA: helix-turn-helix domain-containing protein [Actinocatenispora sp.]